MLPSERADDQSSGAESTEDTKEQQREVYSGRKHAFTWGCSADHARGNTRSIPGGYPRYGMESLTCPAASQRKKIRDICPVVGSSPDDSRRKAEHTRRKSGYNQREISERLHTRADDWLRGSHTFADLGHAIKDNPEGRGQDGDRDQGIDPHTQTNQKTHPRP